jgi:hypothetical protein
LILLIFYLPLRGSPQASATAAVPQNTLNYRFFTGSNFPFYFANWLKHLPHPAVNS